MEFESVAEQLYLTTTRIETLTKSIEGVATGFFFQYRYEQGNVPFVVTNEHVIKEKEAVRLNFIAGKNRMPILGERVAFTVKNIAENWYVHPEYDLAILPMGPITHALDEKKEEIAFRTLVKNDIPTDEQLSQLDAIEDILFIGYPIGLWDSENLLPIVRKGITATPIAHDFLNKPRFLIDASVFPGSSGSPVFLFNRGIYSIKKGGTVVGNRFHFLGILERGFVERDHSRISPVNIPTSILEAIERKTLINIGSVIKSSIVVELIEMLLKEKNLL